MDRTQAPAPPKDHKAWSTPYGFDPAAAPPNEAVPHDGRGFRIGEVLVVVAILAILGAILVAPTHRAHDSWRTVHDADNLKGLMKGYVAGLADGKRAPANVGMSEGSQFWIALYTTDGADEPSDVFLEPGDGGWLVSNRDPVMDEAEVILELQSATSPAVRLHDRTVCSYNGPTVATMRAQSTLSTKIIACTGDRHTEPIFHDGANVLYGNIKVEFLEWEELGMIGNTAVPPHPTAAWLTTLPLPFALDSARVVN